ncbi:MAG: hypothetical protein FI695_02905 [SAR202 cluster bacterium]|nr:hypothetical protein [Chloroflexota bacterium]MQG50909.1 hypothetical protein [SAR202 cluster bacterium]|tara:strand:- start:13849 stop:14880 length:1032 start_codon:yes stop_codon:yes gene_type:complete
MKENRIQKTPNNKQRIIYTLGLLSIISVMFSACFIESKEQILFTQGDTIYIVDSDGNNLKNIMSPNSNSSPSWSPNYDQILFILDTNTVASVHRDKLDELIIYEGLNQELPIKNLQWSPNAQYISFNAGNVIRIYDISTMEEILKLEGYNYHDWSRDSEWIAISSNDNEGIIQRNPLGVNELKRTTDSTHFDPQWSPKNEKLAFLKPANNVNHLYVMDLGNKSESNEPILLNKNLSPNTSYSWSPSGKQIAFTSANNPEKNDEIYVINIESIETTRLTINSNKSDRNPVWSADGTRIAFISSQEGGNEMSTFAAYIMNDDGTKQEKITEYALSNQTLGWYAHN